MNSQWIIWCDTRDERKSRKLLDRLAEELKRIPTGISTGLDEGGYAVRFEIPVCAETWSDIVLELMQLGYAVADHWAVYPGIRPGSIYDAAEGASITLQPCRITGVKRIEWHIENPEAPSKSFR